MYNHATVINLCRPYVAALLLLADFVSGQYTVVRPSGLSSLQLLDVGQGPDPLEWALHLTQIRVDSDPCAGVNDVLAVIFAAPVVGGISRLDWLVNVCPVEVFDSEDNNTLWRPIERVRTRCPYMCWLSDRRRRQRAQNHPAARPICPVRGQCGNLHADIDFRGIHIIPHRWTSDQPPCCTWGRCGYGMCGLHTHRNAPSNAKCHISRFVLEN